MIEVYDVGRVLLRPFDDGYRFIAEHGHEYISDQAALENIVGFHKDRSGKLCQDDFNLLNNAWVQAIRQGRLIADPSRLVYPDVGPRFNKLASRGDKIFLHTSGSTDLIGLMLGEEYQYDELLVAEQTGDKNHPQTFARIWDYTQGQLSAFYDDKPSVLTAAREGFRTAGGSPRLYLVDRADKIKTERLAKLQEIGIIKITSFEEVCD